MNHVMQDDRHDNRAAATRFALVEAAFKLFGQKGYENTTVRDLITEADVNLSAINYHFGGKEGLRLAAIEHLALQFRKDGPGAAMEGLNPSSIADMSPDQARETLRNIMKFSFKRSAQMEDVDIRTRYIQRELIQGGRPTEIFFEKVFSVQFGHMRSLVARVTGEAEDSDVVRMRAINLIAQSVFLNLARPLVLLAMDWDDYSEEYIDFVGDTFWLFHE